jgi:outer membrane lipoprotein SlyB
MRAQATAFGLACSCFIALAWAQGLIIPDLRNPSLYREPSRGADSCRVCGEIRSIREVSAGQVEVGPNPTRAAAGNANDWAVVGAAIMLPTGPDAGSASARVGAVGTPDMAERFGSNTFEIVVRMDTGERVSLQRRDGAFFRVGDRVAVSDGRLEKL